MKFGAVDVDYLISLQEKYQIFEKLIESLYRSVLRQGDHAIDGGAHVAMHTLPMAECVGPNGTVYAFEPSPTVLPWLRELLAPARNVVLIERALSDQDGTAVFRNLPDEPWLSSLDNRPLGSFKRKRRPQATLLRVGLAG